MIELSLKNSRGEEQRLTFQKDTVSIGRKGDNDIPVNDSEMSRYHAVIRFEDGKFLIHDLNSTNGFFYQDVRVREKQELWPQTEIRIGSHTLVFLGSDKLSGPERKEKRGQDVPAQDVPPPAIEQKAEAVEEIKIEDQGHTMFLSAQDLALKATEFGAPATKDAETQKQNVNKNLEVLYNVGKKLLGIKDIYGISTLLLETADKIVQAERIAIQLKDDGDELKTFDFKGLTSRGKFKLSKTITQKVLNERVAIISSDALSDDRFASGASVIMQAIRAMMCVPIWKEENCMGLIYIDNQNSLMGFKEQDLQIISAVANQAAIGIDNIRLNESIQEEIKFRNNLERYHSPDVIDMIMKDPGESFVPQEKDLTILFSDIQGFTTLSEKLSAIEIAEILNEYFNEMTEVIFKHKGTLDKFIGDAIMAIFGAPFSYGDDAQNAVSSALDMLQGHKELMEKKPENLRFGIRIGINSGKAVAGNIGSKKRVDYTVLGDSVNIASRLESKADVNSVFIGEKTYDLVKDHFTFQKIGPSKLKGKEKSVMVYKVLGRRDQEELAQQSASLP